MANVSATGLTPNASPNGTRLVILGNEATGEFERASLDQTISSLGLVEGAAEITVSTDLVTIENDLDAKGAVTVGANDLGTDHLHTNDKLVISDGDDSGISIVSSDEGVYGSFVSLKETSGGVFSEQVSLVKSVADSSLLIKYGSDEDPTANPTYFRLYANGELRVEYYSGSGTQDAQFTSNGTFTRITSDEKTKNVIGKLKAGLDYVLAVSKSTIEFDYKKEELNAEGYHNWGFGARAAVKEYGKQPAFREHEGIYNWDSKHMIAPAYNAISELNAKVESLQKQVDELSGKK